MVILCDFSLWLTSLSIPVSGAIRAVASGITLCCFKQDSGGEVYLLVFTFCF